MLILYSTDEFNFSGKPAIEHTEAIKTDERVPEHTNRYENDGLNTYDNGEDHDTEPTMKFRRIMSLIAMAFRKSACRVLVLEARLTIH